MNFFLIVLGDVKHSTGDINLLKPKGEREREKRKWGGSSDRHYF
jgi:hypothetical protein